MSENERGVSIGACSECGLRLYPVRKVCPKCGSTHFVTEKVYEGKVIESTTVESPPAGFQKHFLVYIDAGDVRILASATYLPKNEEIVELTTSVHPPVVQIKKKE
ncbi:MAG: zinc ribbon domain-containing protein [Thermoprotei archaeon]